MSEHEARDFSKGIPPIDPAWFEPVRLAMESDTDEGDEAVFATGGTREITAEMVEEIEAAMPLNIWPEEIAGAVGVSEYVVAVIVEDLERNGDLRQGRPRRTHKHAPPGDTQPDVSPQAVRRMAEHCLASGLTLNEAAKEIGTSARRLSAMLKGRTLRYRGTHSQQLQPGETRCDEPRRCSVCRRNYLVLRGGICRECWHSPELLPYLKQAIAQNWARERSV